MSTFFFQNYLKRTENILIQNLIENKHRKNDIKKIIICIKMSGLNVKPTGIPLINNNSETKGFLYWINY